MMKAVLSVEKVKVLATKQRGDGFFHRIFINRMSDSDGVAQQRQREAPEHTWHTDGFGEPHLTCVLTVYGYELDSSSLSAMKAGGYVKLSNFDDGHFAQADSLRPNHPVPKYSTTYYPKTNSLYIFPGYFVAHAVFKVNPGAVRYLVVMFVKLRNTLIEGITPDIYLRREWAASNEGNRKMVCHGCYSAFRSKKGLVDQ
jgi:hypothetical protein